MVPSYICLACNRNYAISTKLPTKSLICITGKCKAVRYRGYACGCDRHHDYCSICCISCIGKDECQDLYNYSHCTVRVTS
ncbi:DNA-directed RNA polymerase subunit beta' [Trichinella pseudospiralis]